MQDLTTRLAMLGMLLASSTALAAPPPCKDASVSTDKFTGKSAVTYRVQALSGLTPISLEFKHSDGKTQLLMMIKEFGAVDGPVPEGAEVPFLFGSKVITMVNAEVGERRSYVADDQVATLSPFVFTLNEEALQVMADNPLDSVRLPLAGGDWDWNPRKAVIKRTSAGAACILSKLE